MATNQKVNPRIFQQPEGTVVAVQVRSVDPPQFVAETLGELEEGSSWSGEQCDGCGFCGYTIERDSAFDVPTVLAWSARCSGEADKAVEYESVRDFEAAQAALTGCGARYRLRFLPENQVAF